VNVREQSPSLMLAYSRLVVLRSMHDKTSALTWYAHHNRHTL